jgi:hypothetical protein
MKFASRRVDADGYLELIWRTDVERPEGATPQAIAYISSACGGKPWYWGVYGIFKVSGPTVSDVKQELFQLIETGH